MNRRQFRANAIFISGTDTGVGKTFICGLLYRYLRQKGVNVGYQKWVSTGDPEVPADLLFCLQTAEQAYEANMLDMQVPYRLQYPASPHFAAELEGIELNKEHILQRFQEYTQKVELLVVEGVGGLLVPLRRDLLLIDLLEDLQISTLLVSRSGLGTLNHTLLSLEALRFRSIPVLGVLFNDTARQPDEKVVSDNMRTIEEMGKVQVFGRMHWQENTQEAAALFKPIGEKIINMLE